MMNDDADDDAEMLIARQSPMETRAVSSSWGMDSERRSAIGAAIGVVEVLGWMQGQW